MKFCANRTKCRFLMVMLFIFSANIFSKNSRRPVKYRKESPRTEKIQERASKVIAQKAALEKIEEKEQKIQVPQTQMPEIIEEKRVITPQEQIILQSLDQTDQPTLTQQEIAEQFENDLKLLESIEGLDNKKAFLRERAQQLQIPEHERDDFIAFQLKVLEERAHILDALVGELLSFEYEDTDKKNEFIEFLRAQGVSNQQLAELHTIYTMNQAYLRTKDISYFGFGTSWGTVLGKSSNYFLFKNSVLCQKSPYLQKKIADGFGTEEKPIDLLSITVEDLQKGKKAFKKDEKVTFETVAQKKQFVYMLETLDLLEGLLNTRNPLTLAVTSETSKKIRFQLKEEYIFKSWWDRKTINPRANPYVFEGVSSFTIDTNSVFYHYSATLQNIVLKNPHASEYVYQNKNFSLADMVSIQEILEKIGNQDLVLDNDQKKLFLRAMSPDNFDLVENIVNMGLKE